MDEKLKRCIEVLVHIEGLLTCFVQAIIDVTNKEFSEVYKKMVNHPQIKKVLF